MKKVILIGAGLRGICYTDFALDHKDRYKVVAVAEPVKERRESLQRLHDVPEDMCFESWEELLNMPKFADLVMICTMDREHYEPCMKAIEKKYDILLEKPMSPDPKECVAMTRAAEAAGIKIIVCHVLRFAPFFKTLKGLILDGKIGDVVNIEHAEDVGNLHQSHSFVRGNWGNSKNSSPMILQKSCHDMDILQWLVGKKCKKIQSFGSLSHFNRANKPEGSPERCIEGCPYGETCFYNSVKLYLEDEQNDWFRGAATKNTNPTNAEVEKALRETNYGKCVYSCDNDVVDHQVVNLEFEDGVIASFTMSAFNEGGRKIRVMGTEGILFGDAEENFISYYSFATRKTEKIQYIEAATANDITGGHGGADTMIMVELYDYLTDNYNSYSICSIDDTCDNHLIAFAAEESRTNGGKTIELEEFKKKFI